MQYVNIGHLDTNLCSLKLIRKAYVSSKYKHINKNQNNQIKIALHVSKIHCDLKDVRNITWCQIFFHNAFNCSSKISLDLTIICPIILFSSEFTLNKKSMILEDEGDCQTIYYHRWS